MVSFKEVVFENKSLGVKEKMFPYYFLQFFPPVFGKLIGNKDIKRVNKIIIFTFFSAFLLLLAFRDRSVGVDLKNYYIYFQKYSLYDFKDLLYHIKTPGKNDLEAGYIILNWLISRLTDNFNYFLGIIAIISVVPVAALYYQNSEHAYLSTILFTTIGIFPMFFSGLRQILAVSVGILAYSAAKNKKIIRFVLLVFLATLFHRTAFVLILLYPCCHLKLKKNYLIIIIPILAVFFAFNKPIFLWLVKFIPDVGEVEIITTNAYTMLFLYLIFAIWSFAIGDETKFDAETFGLRNILLIVVIIQMFASVNTLAMRMNYYFLPLIPLLISKIIDRAKPNLQEISVLSNVIICVFFTFYRIYSMYSSEDILQIYPYIPFWKG